MTEHSKDEEEVQEVYQVQCYFKTNIANADYHVTDTVITLQSDFNRKKLNKLVQKLLEETTNDKVKFEFLVKGEILRGSLGEMMQKHNISNDETVEIIYTFSMNKPKEDQKLQNDEWIKTIHTAFELEVSNKVQPMAVGFFDGTVKIYDETFDLVYNKKLHEDEINSIIFNKTIKNAYVMITAGQDEELQLHKLTFKEGKWVDKRYAMVIDHANSLSSCPTSPDFFVYGGDDTIVKIANINPTEKEENKEVQTRHHKRAKTGITHIHPTSKMEGCKTSIN
jgi:WD40 repeat protein